MPIYTLAGSIIAATVAAVATVFTTSSAFDSKMVEIGVGILSADPSKSDVSPAREWAIRLVEKHSGLTFSGAEHDELLRHALPDGRTVFVNSPSPLGLVAAGCSAFKKNPDGSWTQTGKIVTPGNNTFEGTTFKNTGETRLLDQLCK